MTRRVTALVLLSLAALLLHGRFVVPYVMEREAQEAERRRLQAERDGEGATAEDRAALAEQLRELLAAWRAETPRVQVVEGIPGRRLAPLGKAEDSGAATRRWQPPENAVQGLLLVFDNVSERLTLDLGAASGLAKGETLLVYRLRPSATLVSLARIDEVHGNHSVAHIIFLVAEPVVGDQVCSEAFLKR